MSTENQRDLIVGALRDGAIAMARKKYPNDTAGQTDDQVWANVAEQLVTMGTLCGFLAQFVEIIAAIDLRVEALEKR